MLVRALGGPPYSFTVHGPEEFDKPSSSTSARRCAHAAFVVAVSSYGRSQLYRWAAIRRRGRRSRSCTAGSMRAFHAGASDAGAAGAAAGLRRPALRAEGPDCCCRGACIALIAARRPVRARAGRRRRDARRDRGGDPALRPARPACASPAGSAATQVRAEILGARALVLAELRRRTAGGADGSDGAGPPGASPPSSPAFRNWSRDGEHGWLVPAGDVDALATRSRRASTTPPDVLATMGRPRETRVLARHDIDVEAAKLAACSPRHRAVRS